MTSLIGAGPNTPVIGFGGTPGGLMIGQTNLPAGTLVPVAGRDGRGLDVDGRVATYAALPAGLTAGDAGKAILVDADKQVYIWSGSAWPANGSGAQVKGDPGPTGRAITSIAVSGDDLVFTLSDSTTQSVTVPALTTATDMAAIASAAASLAVNSLDVVTANRALAYSIALS
ncbi:hypothetical protein [Rhodococcus opacus]|uniref:Uncharacterized protein n=1 Tax=Rhodococcus opacus TaxID=37919 RepID=A0A2S8JAY9_RHOOP|nr:hypothetical protein [Rhodococcus opacus]PQP24177.1 hypothetical protein C5613_14955 [Rhodococcus opacus]